MLHQEGLSEKELEEAVCNTPFFMTSLPDDVQNNEALLGLQALLHTEESAEDRALNFKTQGNERYQQRDFKNALLFYTQGIEQPVDARSQSILYSNRAAVHFTLAHYENCIHDCRQAITLDPTNVKAIHRLARCFLRYKDYEKALFFIQQALEFDPKNSLLLESLKEIEEGQKKQRTSTPLVSELDHALLKLGVGNIKNVDVPYPMVETQAYSKDGHIYAPCVVIYPEFQQVDHLQWVDLHATLEEALTPLLEQPPSFDPHGRYTLTSVHVYVWNSKRTLLVYRPSLHHTLLSILQTQKTALFNNVLELIVVHQSCASLLQAYESETKKKRKIEN